MSSHNAKYVAYWRYFFRAYSHTYPSILSFPFLSLSRPSLLPFHPAPSSHKEVNKKLSYRRQSVLSFIKIHECNTASERILFLCVRRSRLTEGLMFSVCPSVRLSVCYRLVNDNFENDSIHIGTSCPQARS